MSISWLSYLGILSSILQPPLPEGDPADVVVGTKDWKRSYPTLYNKRTKLVWIDMKQADQDHGNGVAADGSEGSTTLLKQDGKGYENWWPGMRRWNLGVVFQDATLELGDPEIIHK